MRRLVYHAGALGDFITSLPAIDVWRKTDPAILLGKPAHGVLGDPPFVEVWDAAGSRYAALFGTGETAEKALAHTGWSGRLAGTGAALVFASSSSLLPRNLRELGVPQVLRIDPLPPHGMHAVDFHLIAVGAAGLAGAIPTIRRVAQPPFVVSKNTVALAPGSGSVTKNWGIERYEELATLLRGRQIQVAWVIGPAEEALPVPKEDSRWAHMPLDVLAAALASCGLFVGNDSGVSHLAAAAGCPTIALFGATAPATWSPRGTAVRVLASPTASMKDIALRDVFETCCEYLLLTERRRTDVRRRGDT